MEFDFMGYIVIVAAMVSMMVMVVAYIGYKFFHEKSVIEWMARHGIVEIEEEEDEER